MDEKASLTVKMVLAPETKEMRQTVIRLFNRDMSPI